MIHRWYTSSTSTHHSFIRNMTHYGNDEYKHLEGRTLMDDSGKTLVIFKIVYAPDAVYDMTDGHAGKAYQVFFEETDETFGFRYFASVVEKYGKLVPLPPTKDSST